MVKIGLLGCGVALRHHLLALQSMQDVQVLWFCDKDESQAKQAANVLGKEVNIGTDFDALIKNDKPDIIHVCTPPVTHAELTIKALSNGCHVLLEKPMATSAKKAEAILKARDKSGSALCIMHNHMLDPHIKHVRRIVERGDIGDIIYAEGRHFIEKAKMVHEKQDNPEHWVHSLKSGFAGEHGPHSIYLLHSFLGGTKRIQLLQNRLDSGLNNRIKRKTYALQLQFEKAIGRILLSDCSQYANFSIDLYGTLGAIHINMLDLTYRIEKYRTGMRREAAFIESTLNQSLQGIFQTFTNIARIATGRLKRREGHRGLIREFYACLQEGTPVPVTGEEGLETVRTLDLLDQAVMLGDSKVHE